MHLKPFEAGRYDDESIVVANPLNGKQELFSEREFEMLRFLKQNEQQSLLALLLPNIGIAKRNHITMCLSVLSKLRRMQIADYQAITGRPPQSATETMELSPAHRQFEFRGLAPFAGVLQGIGARVLAPLGGSGLLGVTVLLAAVAFALFPFESVPEAFATKPPPYLLAFALCYGAATLAFLYRALLRAAFLRSAGREMLYPAFALFFPLVSLTGDARAVNLLGFRARVQMAVLGLLAPFTLGAVFTLLAMARALDPALAFAGFAGGAGASLALACPLFPFDGADLLQAILFRTELEEKVSERLREIFQTKGALSRELWVSVIASLVWLLVWCDALYGFFGMWSARLADDLSGGFGPAALGAGFTLGLLILLLLLPPGIVLYHHYRNRRRLAQRRVTVASDRVRDSLSFEERVAALEKIPLFASLNEQERLGLLTEMQPAYYRHGDFLVHQGEVGRELFVLVKGQANAFFTDREGKSVPLADLAAGDAFGEIALIDDVPRTASIVSDGGCIVLLLRKDGFERFLATLGSTDRVKAMIRLTSFFRRHPLFSKLSPRDQAMLIDSFRFQSVTTGEQIPSADESFHVVYSGAVRVDSSGAEGEIDLHADDCFGYANPLGVRFVAIEGTGLLTVAKDEFHNLIWEKLVEKPELFM